VREKSIDLHFKYRTNPPFDLFNVYIYINTQAYIMLPYW